MFNINLDILYRHNNVPVWSDVVGIFLSSIVVLTPNGQFLGCVTVAIYKRHDLNGVRGPVVVSVVVSVVHWPTVFPNLCCTDHLWCEKSFLVSLYFTSKCI